MTTSEGAAALTDEQRRYLSEHTLAVLGTGRRDGTPQLSMVSYHFDGADVAISVQRSSAKWRNAQRLPNVTLLVPDGRTQLVIEGRIDLVETDPERVALTRRIREAVRFGELPADDAEFARLLDAEGRVVLRAVPERAIQGFPLYPVRPAAR
jgi:PPOX class probable F420-dependent enzyme